MKGAFKATLSFVLVIVFLFTCFFVLSIGYFAFWLHTYKAFTERRTVAEITISSLQKDEKGEYANVKYTPYEVPSALTDFLSPSTQTTSKTLTPLEFKVYGEVVYVGGPIVKFHDNLILLNFKTIYKVGQLFGLYVTNPEIEKARTTDMFSQFEIDGGFAEWKQIFDDMQNNSFRGKLYGTVIDVTQVDVVGKYISNKDQAYTLYITNNGFLLDEK